MAFWNAIRTVSLITVVLNIKSFNFKYFLFNGEHAWTRCAVARFLSERTLASEFPNL